MDIGYQTTENLKTLSNLLNPKRDDSSDDDDMVCYSMVLVP